MKSWSRVSGRTRLAAVATLVAALAVAGLIAAPLFRDATTNDTGRAHPGSTAPASVDVKPVSKPLRLGTVAKVSSDYKVAVTDLTRYEGSRDQFIVATLRAEYVGRADGDPWADLVVEFSPAGSRKTTGETSCPIDLGDMDDSDAPAMARGDVKTYAVCIDLPSKDIDGGRVSVEEAFSNGATASWSTTGATTKAIPSAAPTTPVQQAPAAPRAVPRRDSDSDNSDSYSSDDLQEYRDKLDNAIEKYENQRDRIKAQLRAWKQAGYHGDAVGDYEDWLNDIEDAIDTYKEQRDKIDRAMGN